MSALARLLAALLVVAVLADASACTTAPVQAERGDGVLRISTLCLCGCHAHTGSPGGVGLTQLAALPAETLVPPTAPVLPARAPLPRLVTAPPHAIDHVPIPLA